MKDCFLGSIRPENPVSTDFLILGWLVSFAANWLTSWILNRKGDVFSSLKLSCHVIAAADMKPHRFHRRQCFSPVQLGDCKSSTGRISRSCNQQFSARFSVINSEAGTLWLAKYGDLTPTGTCEAIECWLEGCRRRRRADARIGNYIRRRSFNFTGPLCSIHSSI